MKILIVNTYDKGGAANACLRLHEGLLGEHIDSKVLLKRKVKGLPKTFQFVNKGRSKSKFQILKQKWLVFLRVMGILKREISSRESQFLKQRPDDYELFSFPNSNFDITSSALYQEADIINLHWVANFLDYESFFRKNSKPVVWTLHDMNPFTGGEHYLEEFLGIDDFGYPLRREFSKEEKEISNINLALKQKVIQNASNLTIVAPSRWLCEEAEKSIVFNKLKVHCIPYGINSEIFQPRDKIYSRDILNIPKGKMVLLFVAESVNNRRKGYAYLKKALDMLKRDDIVLCAVGSKNSDLELMNNIKELGAISDERLMSIVYSAADVFIIPSLMDNLPNSVLEALMCGTPVIGFPIGGVPDMIINGQNGLLTEEISASSLLKTIEYFLLNSHKYDRKNIQKAAFRKYNLNVQARAYVKLFNSIKTNANCSVTDKDI